MPLVTADNISKSYGTRVLLDRINLGENFNEFNKPFGWIRFKSKKEFNDLFFIKRFFLKIIFLFSN